MKAEQKTPEQIKKEAELKLKKFQLRLEELLDEFNYTMDVKLSYTAKGIIPQLVVDTPEQVTSLDVKQKKQEQRPDKKSKKGKGKN